jgi:hypothetical protein
MQFSLPSLSLPFAVFMVLFSVVVSPVYHIIVSRQVKNPEKIKKFWHNICWIWLAIP